MKIPPMKALFGCVILFTDLENSLNYLGIDTELAQPEKETFKTGTINSQKLFSPQLSAGRCLFREQKKRESTKWEKNHQDKAPDLSISL